MVKPNWVALRVFMLAAISALPIVGCSSKSTVPLDLTRAKYVGQAACVECHREQSQAWIGSHHDQAMQVASEKTVLANFDNVTLTHQGITSRMFRDQGRFMVNTEGPDGTLQDFEVKYVFGVDPLQQYMVEFPSAGLSSAGSVSPASLRAYKADLPRVQVLRLCWDTEKKAWFHLDPPDVAEKLDPHDDLHWTGIAQRWNNMCAECHSTDYQKNFLPPSSTAHRSDTNGGELPANPGEYHSTFVEINVSCEACHGPGSVHVELAKRWSPGWNRQRGYGLANLKLTAENQIQACAPCHSRRNNVHPGFRAGNNYYDFYSNQLLTEDIYYPDGQVLDEDYVHGSFIQSKMYHKGIRCTDCHDPHTARLKHDGNEVCTSCHQHPSAKYDSVAHHFHKVGSEGAKCVNCHMPTTTYMAVDARRDHSLRLPRPDLSLKIGTPNACTGCHLKPGNVAPAKRERLKLYQDWMAAARSGDAEIQAELKRVDAYCNDACERWYGEARRRDEHWGVAIAAGQTDSPNATSQLKQLLSKKGYEGPAIARATALQMLSEVDPHEAVEEAAKLITDEHPLVRAAAAGAMLSGDSPVRAANLLELALQDPVRCVRVEAARNLIELPANVRSESSKAALQTALNELEQGMQYNNDRAGAHLAMGIFAEQQNRIQQAISHYRDAIAVEPGVSGARTNLASLLERNLQTQTTLTSAAVESLKEQVAKLRSEELQLLKRDVELLPTAAGIQYRYGLGLYVAGRKELAAEHLIKAAEIESRRPEYAQAAAMALESAGRWSEAIQWAQTTLRLSHNAPENQMLLQRITQGAEAAQRKSQ